MRMAATGAAVVGLLAITSACIPFAEVPLPTATATLHFATVDLPRGSYCWSGGGHAECADSAGPDMLLKTRYLKPYRTAGGFDAFVKFHGQSDPRTFHVSLVQTPENRPPAPIQSRGHTFAIPAVTPGAAGVYVYSVGGTWAEGDVSFFLALELLPGTA